MHGMLLTWVSCSFFCSHTHSSSLAWVSCLFSCSHTHSSSLTWVSCSFSCSHTHSSSLTWVSCLFFCSHTHNSSLTWVSCSFLYLHTKLFQIDLSIFNNNAFFSQTRCLLFCSAKSERITQFSLCINNTKTRNMLRIWIFV